MMAGNDDNTEIRNVQHGPCPYLEAGVISKVTFWWMNPIFRAGRRKKLSTADQYDVISTDQSSLLANKLERSWNEELATAQSRKKNPSLFKAIFRAFIGECLFYGIFLLVSESVHILQPYLIGRLIGYFDPESNMSSTEVYIIAAVLAVTGPVRLVFDTWYFFQAHYFAMRIKVATGSLIYRKALKVSSLSLHKTSTGQIVNFLSTDLETFNFVTENLHFVWVAPLHVIIVMYLVYQHVGLAMFFMFPVILCLIPLQAFLGRLFGALRTKIGGRTDKRLHVMNEIIAGIRVIKMYCWEKPFSRVISQLRRKEIAGYIQARCAGGVNISLFLVASPILMTSIIGGTMALGIDVSAQSVFAILGWLECLKMSLFRYMLYLIDDTMSMRASTRRIKKFLVLEEMQDLSLQNGNSSIRHTNDVNNKLAVDITDMTAVWSTFKRSHSGCKGTSQNKDTVESKLINKEEEKMDHSFSLNNINLKIPKGELIAVVGAVGSGKSSLLMTLLGELPATDGGITINGKIGYVSQQPWVISGTVRNNILYGQDIDSRKYSHVVQVCALERDIEQMSHRDMTLVGERGLMLSGGQKARISLARAIYKDFDVYLLDDPLGAVDTDVGNHLYSKCICGYLENKTRVLVTHQLQYLKTADRIVVIKEGRILSVGTYEELMNVSSELSQILSELHGDEEDHKQNEDIDEIPETEFQDDISLDEIEDEDIEKGVVNWRVYKEYLSSGYPSITLPLLIGVSLITYTSLLYGEWHLARWAEFQDVKHSRDTSELYHKSYISNSSTELFSHGCRESNCYSTNISRSVSPTQIMSPLYNKSDADATMKDDSLYYTYAASVAVYIVAITTMSLISLVTLNIAGRRLHDKMFMKVIGAKTLFFDTNPLGRVLNRFGRDVGLMDDAIPEMSQTAFEIACRICALAIATCVINPLLLIPLCPVVICIVFLKRYAVSTTRHLKRMEAVTKSPVFSHLSDTLRGLQTIRALNKTKDAISEFDAYQNQSTSAIFLFLASFRWFSFRSTFAVNIYFIFVVVMSLILKDVIGITGGLYGLLLVYVQWIADPFEFLMRLNAELETFMTSVERITHYTKLEQEAEKTSNNPPPPSWPKEGRIVFKQVSLKYSEMSPFVLKNLNCSINGEEKIGVVGRTGAGKSSLLTALVRFAEPLGSIVIDDIDVLKIGLHELRAKVSVIPQDPVLFGGTLRYNLDPFEKYDDVEIWDSLEQVQLKTKIEGMTGQLYADVSEGGKNFSVGQRQLVCLARAVLHNNKILILDEATANVDHMTDELIQRTIRERFKDCTVLTIAHRLHTIMDSDRVLVLDDGQVKEFDTPYKLLQKEDGYFRKLVDQTGPAQALLLQSIAEESNKIKSKDLIDV